jgi:Ferritin-like
MKTIAQFVQSGISTPADLKDALQTAIRLEFATIPPYLCAQWSINADPSGVGDTIQNIAVQEMSHFALAGNMLSAIGAVPDIANATFMPTYPTSELPGGIAQKLPVDLKPLSRDQLEVFMQIETPEFPPVALAPRAPGPATIGEFYDTIATGFTTVQPAINPNAKFVTMGEATPITSVSDAQNAIALIKAEGEGTPGSPDQPPIDAGLIAHYYKFKEIFVGKTLVQSGGKWSFTGPAIQFPRVSNFARSTKVPSPSLQFNQAMSQFLINLRACWTTGGDPSMTDMFNLQTLGQALIATGVLPEFVWAPPSPA